MAKYEIYRIDGGKVVLRGQMSKAQAQECCERVGSLHGTPCGYRLAHKTVDDRRERVCEPEAVSAQKPAEKAPVEKGNDVFVFFVEKEPKPGFWSVLWDKFVALCRFRLF